MFQVADWSRRKLEIADAFRQAAPLPAEADHGVLRRTSHQNRREHHARELIHDAFRERIGTLPREIRPEVYKELLEEIGVRSRPERELLGDIVKDEISSAHLAVTRA